jgi:ribonucleoside-triphosphate reductase
MTGNWYSQAPENKTFRTLLRNLAKGVDLAAQQFCHDLRIPVPVKLRTIAPTGTVAKLSGVSEGIHPIFSKYFLRRIRFNKLSDAEALAGLVAEGYDVEDDLFAPNTAVVTIPTKDTLVQEATDRFGAAGEEFVEAADDLTLDQLLGFQALYQTCWADNAVSFTANVDARAYTSEDVAQTLQKYSGILKGSTIFPEASYPQAPYERITKEQYESASVKAVADGVDEDCANGACPIK